MPKSLFMGYIVPLSILVPIVTYSLKAKWATNTLRLPFYFLICSGLINLAALMMIEQGKSNLPLLHLYTIVEATFFLLYFRSIFVNSAIKNTLTIAIFAFPIFCIINFVFLQSIFTYNTYTRPLEAIIITIACLTYFYKSGFSENWLSSPVNWINMGILIYFPAATIIFILSNYFTFVKLHRELVHLIWNIHAFLVLMMYLFWTKGFSLMKKNG